MAKPEATNYTNFHELFNNPQKSHRRCCKINNKKELGVVENTTLKNI
ncbi:MAG: hypothetical protein NZM09_11360 [Ignavibacterium sp.]|nr:hypothetical protein [Ignavibacterium sp.]MDW8376275.1 hypothetical protein [Ignavibacteriales bacterium]